MPAHRINLNNLRNKIISEAEKRDCICNRVNVLFYKLRKHCPHNEVVETVYQRDDETRSQLPKRICLCCALEEQASGFSGMCNGFQKLEKSHVAKTVSLEEFSKYKELRPLKKSEELQPA